MIPNAHAEDVKNIEFGEMDTQGYAELDSHTPSYNFQLWHYSGGYWGNETYGIKLMDADVAEGIDTKGIIKYKHPVTIKTDLPAKVKEYLASGGSLDDILIKFELTNGLQDVEIFSNIPTYSINDKQITVSFEPKFAVKTEYLVDHPGMNVHVPIIPEGYGQMVYAMYTPGGKHLGQGTNVEPEDITDCDGNLREGKMYAYNMAGQPSQQLPGGKIKIGSGTFANGGAVGLEYLFPIKATYYIPDQWWVDVLTTEPVEIPEDWREDTHLVVGKVATDEGLDNLENKAQDLTYYQDGDKVNLDFTFWNPMDDCSIAPFEYAVMYWDYSGGWDAMTGKHKESYIHTGLTERDIFPRDNAGELDYKFDINVNQYPFELTTGKQINKESIKTEPVFGNKINPCKDDDLFMTLAIVADPDAVFSVRGVEPGDQEWISLWTNIMIVHVPVKVEGVDLAIEAEDKIVLQAVSGEPVNVKVSMASFRNDFSMEPVEAEIKWEGPEGEGSKIKNFVFGDIEPTVVSFTGYAGNTYHVKGEIMPTTETDIDLTNNYCETEIIIVVAAPEIDPDVGKEAPSPDTRVNIIG